MTRVELWTDGACAGNPGPGGYGWTTSDGKRQGSGGRKRTTNQRMEVEAVGQGLLSLYRDPEYRNISEIEVVSDSRYVVDCFNKEWYIGWEARGWKTSSKQPVKNLKLWQTTLRVVAAWETRGVTVKWRWVKGHAGHELNEVADRLAVAQRDLYR